MAVHKSGSESEDVRKGRSDLARERERDHLADPRDTAATAGGQHLFFPGWSVVALCFLSLNFSVGIVFAAYSPLVVAIQEQFGTSRTLASSALSATGLMLGLCAPLVGGLVQRFSARSVMMGGCALVALGFLLAAFVTNVYALIAIYGTLIGAGFVAMGIVPCSTLVTRWFNEKRGLALGIINLFPGMALFPVIVTYAVTHYELRGALLANAAMFAILLPLLFLIANRPQDKGLAPLGGEPEEAAPAQPGAAPEGAGALLRSPSFWLLSIGIALITGIANMLTVHLMPMLLDAGIPAEKASIVPFIYGMVLAFSAPFFGALIDRIGPFRTLMLEVAIAILPWIGMAILPVTFSNFALLLCVVGLANGGIVTLHTATAAKLFSQAQFSRAIGLGYFVKMPFLFIGPPLGGFVFDRTGSYEFAILIGIGVIVITAALFAILLAANRPAAEQPASA